MRINELCAERQIDNCAELRRKSHCCRLLRAFQICEARLRLR
jgi:hypothetical protein